jgi:predicted DNA-binding ribbon-helix-helix protein
MGKNVSTAVVSFRLTHGEIEDLKKIASERDLTVNKMLARMIRARIGEIRAKENW